MVPRRWGHAGEEGSESQWRERGLAEEEDMATG